MFDKLRDDPKLQVIVIIAGTAIIISIAILLLVFVWIPKDDKNEEEVVLGVGEYTAMRIQEKQVLEKYSTNINNLFSGGDLEYINKYIDKEYLKYIGINEIDAADHLYKKGLIGKLLKFSDYNYATNIRHGRVYSVDVETYDNTFKDKIFIIEKYPNDYKLSFDNFIGYIKEEKNYTVEGLTLNIHDIKELASKIIINATVINKTGKTLIFNSGDSLESVYTNSGAKLSSNFFKGTKKEVLADEKFNINMEFNTDYLQTGDVTEIIIKDVYSPVDNETKEYNFNIK